MKADITHTIANTNRHKLSQLQALAIYQDDNEYTISANEQFPPIKQPNLCTKMLNEVLIFMIHFSKTTTIHGLIYFMNQGLHFIERLV